MLRLDKKFIFVAALFCGVNVLAAYSGTPSSNSGNSGVVSTGEQHFPCS